LGRGQSTRRFKTPGAPRWFVCRSYRCSIVAGRDDMIKAIVVVKKNGKVRLSKFYCPVLVPQHSSSRS
jgi:hypothetical protein